MIKKPTYYPLFDWLRISLAIIVALYHDKVLPWEQSGNLAVQVFFALSGWLIGGILLDSSKADLPRFFFNRVTRIWAPYVVAIMLLISVSLIKDTVTPKWLEFIFYKVTFVYNWFGTPQLASFREQMPLQGSTNHFWSICTEEQFYLLAPWLIVFLPDWLGKSVALWLIIALVAIAEQLYGSIAIGVAAAVLKHHYGCWHLNKWAIVSLFLAFAGLVAALYFEWWPYMFVAPLFSVVTVLLLARFGAKNSYGEFFGGISYPFYLNHWIGVFAAHKVLAPFGLREAPVSKALALFIDLAVAAILYLIVDYNIRKYRSSWFTKQLGLRSAYAAYSLMVVGTAGGLLLLSNS